MIERWKCVGYCRHCSADQDDSTFSKEWGHFEKSSQGAWVRADAVTAIEAENARLNMEMVAYRQKLTPKDVEAMTAVIAALNAEKAARSTLETETKQWYGPGITYPCGCRSIGLNNEPPWYCLEHNSVETIAKPTNWFDGGYLENGRCSFMQAMNGWHYCCRLPHAHDGPHVADEGHTSKTEAKS